MGRAGAAPRAPRSRAGGALPIGGSAKRPAPGPPAAAQSPPRSPTPEGGRETRAFSPDSRRLGAPRPWRAAGIPEQAGEGRETQASSSICCAMHARTRGSGGPGGWPRPSARAWGVRGGERSLLEGEYLLGQRDRHGDPETDPGRPSSPGAFTQPWLTFL